MRHFRPAVLVWVSVLICLGGGLSAAEIIGVTPLARNGRVLVSFELSGAFTEEIRATILSGLPTTFSYDVELRRAQPFWFDRAIAGATISVSVRYDNLRRSYRVSRLLDGRVEETRVVEDQETVRRLMTSFDQLALFSTAPLEANAEYYVRVRARTRPRTAWFFWPWDGAAASASVKFTFIP